MSRVLPDSPRRVLFAVAGATGLGVLIALAVGVGTIRLLTEVDPWPVLRQVNPLMLLAAVAFFVFGNTLVGHRFLALLPEQGGSKPNSWAVGSIFFGTSVFSLMLPGPVGEVAAVAALDKRYGIKSSIGLATAVHARFVGLAAAATIALAVLPFVVVESAFGQVLLWGAVLLCVGGAGLGVVSANPAWLQRLGAVLTGPADATGLRARLLSSIRIFAVALASVSQASFSTWLKVFGWSLVIQSVQMGAMLCIAAALGIAPALPGIALAQGTGSLAILVGIFLPGGLGTYEVAFIGSMVGPGMLEASAAGVLVIGMRIVHLLGLASAGLMFAYWARLLLSDDLVTSVDELRH